MELLKTILLLDNDNNVLDATRFLLENRGYIVFIARSKDEAYSILEKSRIGIVISDIRFVDDGDPSDYSGLSFLAELAITLPTIGRIAQTGFKPSYDQLIPLIPALGDQIIHEIVAKQDGPSRLIEAISRVTIKIDKDINHSLKIHFDRNLSLRDFVSPMQIHYLDLDSLTDELDELLRRLFLRESSVKLHYIPPGRGGTSVMLVWPKYGEMSGLPVVIKFGSVKNIDREIRAYKDNVEPFVHRHSTILVGSPARTCHLAGCKLLFVGCTTDKPDDFNTFYQDRNISSEKLCQVIHNFFQNCVWYQGKRDWERNSDGALSVVMEAQLSLDFGSDGSELRCELDNILDGKSFHNVAFNRISGEKIRIECNGNQEELYDPVYFVSHKAAHLPQPTYASITHGDLNALNMFVDEVGHIWLIDFYRTGWGPSLCDAAELESVIKFGLIQNTNLSKLISFERAILSPLRLSEKIIIPDNLHDNEFLRALATIQTIRESAGEIAEIDDIKEYDALLLYYALKMMTLKGFSSINTQHQKICQRHALYSAAVLSSKLVPSEKKKKERIA
jgi:CheY-like chemotaxis protein